MPVIQALVGDEQERQTGRFVDAAALGLDDPVLDLIAHPEAVASADGVGLHHQRDQGVERDAVQGHRPPLVEADASPFRA